MKFSKKKMMERVISEGRECLVDKDTEKIMEDCDGQEVNFSCWERVVKGEPVVWCVGKSGNGFYVSDKDLI